MPPSGSTDLTPRTRQADRGSSTPARRIDVRSLLGSASLLMIEHGSERYYLRMTRNNKLILTK